LDFIRGDRRRKKDGRIFSKAKSTAKVKGLLSWQRRAAHGIGMKIKSKSGQANHLTNGGGLKKKQGKSREIRSRSTFS